MADSSNIQSIQKSSDSSDEDKIIVKKKRSRTKRGLAKCLKTSEDVEDEGVSSISTHYTTSTLIKKSSPPYKIENNNNLDIEDDFCSLFQSKKSPTRQKTREEKPPAQTISAIDLSLTPEKSDEKTEEEILHISNSPTPPNSPDGTILIRKHKIKKPKIKAGVKKAMKNLSKASADFCSKNNETLDDEDDIVTISPGKSPSNSKTVTRGSIKQIEIKVRSRSGIQRFSMSPNQTFFGIMQEMSAHEFVKVDQIVLLLRDVAVNATDTPAMVGLTVADIVECHVRKPGDISTTHGSQQSDDILFPDSDPNVISLRIRGKDSSSGEVLKMRKTETMERVFRTYADRLNHKYSNLHFTFDGEDLSPDETALELDLDNDFCIDVVNKASG